MFNVVLAQIQIHIGRPDLNFNSIIKFINQAKSLNANMIVFPNLDCSDYMNDILNCAGDIELVFENKSFNNFDSISDSSSFILNKRKIFSVNGKPLIYVNGIGLNDCGKSIKIFNGNSSVYNSKGQLIFQATNFDECLKVIDIDVIDSIQTISEQNFSQPAQIFNAISYGVKTFLQTINMNKIVIGVSGGIDSAVNAGLYTKILGSDNVLLVNMPSKFNSNTTKDLSAQLAKNLGCRYVVIPIQESVDHTVNQIESLTQMKVSSFNRENIQARDRSSRILACLASVFGGGFTCNANKTETTIGYATMYGDCAGVLSALADLWKFQVYQLAHYINDEVYHCEVIPQGIIDIVPSAELSSEQNVDEGKGDPLKYDYHDFLFRAFVEREVPLEDILKWYATDCLEEKIGCQIGLVKKYFNSAEDFINDLERWFKLFKGIAVAKRLQAPPLIAITNHPFDFIESQAAIYFSPNYLKLKDNLLK